MAPNQRTSSDNHHPPVTPPPPPITPPPEILDPPGTRYAAPREPLVDSEVDGTPESRLIPPGDDYRNNNNNNNNSDDNDDEDYNYTFHNVKPRFRLPIILESPLRAAIAAVAVTSMDNGGQLLQRLQRYRHTLQSSIVPIVTLFLIGILAIFGIRSLSSSSPEIGTANATITSTGDIVAPVAELLSVEDLRALCPQSDSSLDIYKLSEDIVQRRDDFASFVVGRLHDNNDNLALRSCVSSNLAVLYLAAHPPLEHMNQFKIRFALTSLYFATNGEEWYHQNNWLNEDKDVCHWEGVSCNDAEDVIKVVLSKNNLDGDLPEHDLIHLDTVQVLDLSMNSVTGKIPSSFEMLKNLVQLELAFNEFTGTVPDFIFQQDQYKILDLAYFGGSMGKIPSSIGNLTSLQRFMAPHTRVSGKLPTELGSCWQLKFLDLSKNDLEGYVPSELGTLSALQTLYLKENDALVDIAEEVCNLMVEGSLLSFDLEAQCSSE